MRTPILVIFLILLISAVSATTVYIAQGDPVSFEVKPGGSCWYFPQSGIGIDYDLPPTQEGGLSYCTLSGKKTASMSTMEYRLIYQEPAIVNGVYFKDLSWKNDQLVSSFTSSAPISESGKQGLMVMDDLKSLITKNRFNTCTENTIIIQRPDTRITDMGKVAENLYRISGTSNFADGTPILIKVDEDRYYSQHDLNFTYHTKVIRPHNEISGTWSDDMLMPFQTMPPGWHDIAVYSGELITTVKFYIDEQEWKPGPTPTQYVKYLSDGNLAPQIVTVVQEKIVDHYIDKWHTATPTPAVTDALGRNVEYPYKAGDQIPGWVALLALLCIAGLVLVRDWKWKK
jgi:hypothetical protein